MATAKWHDEAIVVRVPPALRGRTGDQRFVPAFGSTVREIIGSLERDFPGMRYHLCHETGELRPYVNIFLDTEEIRYLQGLDTPVEPGSQIIIMHSVAGG